MPETEIMRLILQGGSFALLALIAIWTARIGLPRLMQYVDDQRKEFLASNAAQVTQFTTALQQMEAKFTLASQRIEERVDREAEECRRERKDQWKVYVAEREADRVARHTMMNQFQAMLADMYNRFNRRDREGPFKPHGPELPPHEPNEPHE